MKRAAIPGLLLAVSLLGCAGGPPLVALENRTFYQRDDEARGAERRMLFEQDYPPLNGNVAGAGSYVGVTVLGGSVRLSRPAGWQIRRASLTPEQRFIEYVSPHGYLVAIYERADSPADSWGQVQDRYEEDAKAKGADVLGKRIPFATGRNQGREYVVRRVTPGQRAAYVSFSKEVLVRSERRVDLIEVVEGGHALPLVTTELLRVMETLEVL